MSPKHYALQMGAALALVFGAIWLISFSAAWWIFYLDLKTEMQMVLGQ